MGCVVSARCTILNLIKQFFGKKNSSGKAAKSEGVITESSVSKTSKTKVRSAPLVAQKTGKKNHNTHSAKEKSHSKFRLKASEYGIQPRMIQRNALTVVEKLQRGGYEAYVVGGCLRDLLLDQKPKDFDVATNASPEQIKKVFQRQCRLIGRRFRLAHIMFGRDVIEVATFRAEHQAEHHGELSRQNSDGMLLRDNVFGNLENDAQRRDFSVNALYYDPKNNLLIDYFNGVEDLRNGKLRLIGDAETRYQEDPVRMLRAVRFMAKLDMFLDRDSENPIKSCAVLLKNIPAARLFDESLKLLQNGAGFKTYELLHRYDLLQYLFPSLSPFFTEKQDSLAERMIRTALQSTDERIRDNLRVNPAFLFAAFFWYPLREKMDQLKNEADLNNFDAFSVACSEILDGLCRAIAVPKRYTMVVRDIWSLQLQLPKRSGNRAEKTVLLPKFRAGYDLLTMRAELEGGDLVELATWWHEYQLSNPQQRENLMVEQNQRDPQVKKKRRYRRRKPSNRAKSHAE
ncbi:polynucleotide adenylyltransferase PcnB [Pasteurellaceae bacterium USgator11]|nr:polynucleotide adenylyltransferase PcnB [Pasteurellaceae bacterium UScroc12]TNG94493.1 polynucleotide adenylyltransferase PcnB [Pasteurellaceae bacterium USgator41]TNG97382.1 polynucleotide adenylyltransferase PcnB [Pasteurellaceae bacterium UScroc31]TNH00896.1 polynucleotide adenylyltransferase PcnB [Pasteurellaceae bacterium USgator11]